MKTKGTKRNKTAKKEQSVPFSSKVLNFIKVYAGSVKEAAELSSVKYGYARKLMTRPDIVEAIRSRNNTPKESPEVKKAKLDKEEIETWLTEQLRDPKNTALNKFRAVDKFCKLNCLYSEKRVLETDKPLEVNANVKEIDIEERKRMLDEEQA